MIQSLHRSSTARSAEQVKEPRASRFYEWFLLATGIALTLLVAGSVKRLIDKDSEQNFEFAGRHLTELVEHRFHMVADAVQSGVPLLAHSGRLNQAAWQDYVATLRERNHLDGLQDIFFLAATGNAAFSVPAGLTRFPPGEAARHVTQFANQTVNWTQASAPQSSLRDAMEMARDTGKVMFAVQPEDTSTKERQGGASILLVVAVYGDDVPGKSIAQRRQALVGWACIQMAVDDLINGVLSSWQEQEGGVIDVDIYEGRQAIPAAKVFDSRPENVPRAQSAYFREHEITAYGRHWLLVFDRTQGPSPAALGAVWATLIAGLAISWLMYFLRRSARVTLTRAQNIAADLTATVTMNAKMLQESESRYRGLADNSFDWVWAIDMDGRTTYSNGRVAEVLGWNAEEIMANPGLSLVHPDDAPDFHEVFERAVASRSGWKAVLIRFRHKDGSYRTLESSAMPMFNLDGELAGFQGMDRDVTERMLIATELNNAKIAAEDANRAKSRFLAAASHDLRQPLSTLSLYVGLLPKLILPQAQDLAANMAKCVTSLSELLNDLLDMSKLDAGVVVPKESDIGMDALFAKLKAVFEAKAKMRGIRLKVRNSGLVVCSDPQLLQRVIGNLIDNAIRYTEKGGVLVTCRHRHGRPWVEVWDTGVGIDADKTGIIFEEFRQLGDQSRNRGSGLGLAIDAKTAEVLNLKVRLCSRPGRGSMFAIELPPLAAPSAGSRVEQPVM